MAGNRPTSATEPIGDELASLLRHDLVTPINLIVGYCDLLVSEAADTRFASCADPLRSIRACAFALLGEIDQVLLADRPERSLVDLQAMARSLLGPTEVLVRACVALDAQVIATSADDAVEFRDDLARIHAAGERMIVLAEILASGQVPEDGRLQVPDTT